MKSNKIIGGMMGLGEGDGPEPAWPSGDRIYLANARSGIFYAVQAIRPTRIWMPSFLCQSMLHPSYTFSFYDGKSNLHPASDDLVVGISYFGMPTEEYAIEAAIKTGAIFLEDASMSIYSRPSPRSHLVLYSMTKAVPLPDGAVLVDRIGMAKQPLSPSPGEWIKKSIEARRLRTQFDLQGIDTDWFARSQEAKKLCPTGLYAMSDYSRSNLGCIDHEWAMISFRNNYRRLSGKDAPEGAIPTGCPILVKNRDEVLARLYEKKIFPPVHWRLGRHVPEAHVMSHWISDHILTLPCDYRYDEHDMDRIKMSLFGGGSPC